jgi:hypothetical protein
MVVLDHDFRKLTVFESECNAPRQLYDHAPVISPIALQLVLPNIWGLTLDAQVI